MKLILSKLYKLLSNRFYFKLIYIFIGLSFTTIFKDFLIIHLLNKLILIWGVVLIFCEFIDIVLKRRSLHLFDITLYLFILLTLILNLYNYPSIDNLKTWLINCILLISVFSPEEYKEKITLEKELKIISIFYVSFTLLSSLLSIILINSNFLFNKLKLVFSSIDFTDYCGIFSNSNALGISAALSIIISLYLITTSVNKRSRILLTINSIFQFIVLTISNGRSGFFIIIAIVFIFIFVKFKNWYLRSILAITPMILLSFIILNLHSFIGFLSGRYHLWYTAYNLLHYWPKTGVGFSNMIPMMTYYQVATELAYLPGITTGGIHNIYLQTAVINGLFSLFLLLLSMILIFIFIIKKLDRLDYSHKKNYIPLLSLFLGILLINLMESNLLYIISFISIIFWVYTSYLIALLKE